MYVNPNRSAFGVPTFGKAPLIDLAQEWEADVVVIGVPFDQAVTFRPGTRFGSRAVRDASLRYAFFQKGTGFWDMRTETWRAQKRVVDAGDIDVIPLDYATTYENITKAVTRIVSGGALPFVIGGDHSITEPVLRGLKDSGPITIIHFDAHTDYRHEVGGQTIGHAQVIRRSLELPFVTRSVSLGIRAIRTDPADMRAMKEDGCIVATAAEIHRDGVNAIADILPRDENIYVTFDIDSLDPAFAPGTGTIETGGLNYEQARALLQAAIERNRLVGFDLVEVNPMLDTSGITATVAAQVAMDALGFAFPGPSEPARLPED
ncbi:MAG: agmatinase [Variibacter sp.]